MTTTVWHNGKVWINKNDRTTAIAARDGKICAHGEDAILMMDHADIVIDLDGKSLVPGFGDGHAHPVYGGVETIFAPVRGHDSIESLLEIGRAHV